MAQSLQGTKIGTANILRWRVGDFKITSIPESESRTTPKFIFGNAVDKKRLVEIAGQHPWLAPDYVTNDGFLLQKIQALVIDNGKMRMVVDTCIGNDKKRSTPGWSDLKTEFLGTMRAAGYPADSITHVVCTHLHVDHVGWNTKLENGRWVPTFPNARYLFARPEYEHWSRTDKGSYDGENIMADSVEPVVKAGLVDMVPVDHVVADGIRFEPTVGHTPGHISVVIESKGARAVVTGDMTHTPVQIAEPGMSTVLDWDPDMAAATRQEFFRRWADEGALIIGTHFGTPTAGMIVDAKRADKPSYRLEKLPPADPNKL
ncbi:putative metallo-beta-lactamase superfamily protein [Hyaloraphidium curvatum]|nr:putative metallo-beta-lactamase superfamily protein [Hyaloraphidium curvatum]